ncbi:hypothetical protein DMH04_54280 [Kibdelosporangium aridum]|uniref:Uncharacterized protein n=1 Tax=Kibdelosporangium aridum TaxID=2030 RepID=A0A428XY56_KIBAR|nr:hypothetical protein DMH04_54280 [Kibdelosporangium aridum]
MVVVPKSTGRKPKPGKHSRSALRSQSETAGYRPEVAGLRPADPVALVSREQDRQLIAAICGPSTGFLPDDLVGHARAGWDTNRDTRPPFDQLDQDQRDALTMAVARKLAKRLTDPPRPAMDGRGRPVNHHAPSSPPFPTGADELRFWTRRLQARVNDLRPLADRGNRRLVAGRLTEAGQLLARMRQRTPAATGQKETAHWITVTADRAADLPTIPGQPYLTGRRAEAEHWAALTRRRQQNHATPAGWSYGGQALIDALAARRAPGVTVVDWRDGPGTELVALSPEVVVIAASDTNTQQSVLHILSQWTGRDRLACELAVRKAVDAGLVTISSGIDKPITTDKGAGLYSRLTRTLQTTQTRVGVLSGDEGGGESAGAAAFVVEGEQFVQQDRTQGFG